MWENTDADRAWTVRVAAALSTRTGHTWQLDESWKGHGAMLAGPQGRRIWCSFDRYRQKVELRGHFDNPPEGADIGVSATRIGVGLGREADAVARDMTRRLLPAYEDERAEWLRRREAILDDRAGAERLALQLAAVIGVEPTRSVGTRKEMPQVAMPHRVDWSERLTFDVEGTDRVRLKVPSVMSGRLAVAIAEAVARTVLAAEPAEPAEPAEDEFSHLDDPAERAWLRSVDPQAVMDNAHRFYDFMREAGIPVDSYTRELAFQKAAKALGVSYDVLYDAWIGETRITSAGIISGGVVTQL